MRINLDYGRSHVAFDVPEDTLAVVRHQDSALTDPAAAVRDALEKPYDFPPLRRALTPDDHVAIVIDEQLPNLAKLLTPLLEHLAEARVTPEAVTLLCAPPAGNQGWVDDLPDAFQDVRIEVHDPSDRRKLSYLATTKAGRRIYLNRTAVDADQLVVLARRGYDALLGYSGAEAAIYPALSDAATRQEAAGQALAALQGKGDAPLRLDAVEVAWLLGAPFLVQVIEGAGEDIAHVIGGSLSSTAEGQRLLDARWRQAVRGSVRTVIAALSGDAHRHQFAELAQALAAAARVVQANGQIVLLTEAMPQLGPAAHVLREADDPTQALERLAKQASADRFAACQWAAAAQQAHIYLLSGLDGETAEELFTMPLDDAAQAQRLLSAGGPCLFLADAHKALAVLESEG